MTSSPTLRLGFVLLAMGNGLPAQTAKDFYDGDTVQTIRLEVKADDMKRLRAALPKRIYVPATFRWRDVVLERVGLRYKGNSSSNPRQTFKRSFLIKFSEFSKGQRFLGLRRVALDNGVQFGSLFSERLITDILREAGALASRANYARLELNGKFHGVYVNVERIDRSFLEHHLPGKATMFKVHDGGRGADLQFHGDDPEHYKKTFALKVGSKKAGHRELVHFIKMLRDTPDADLAARLGKAFELDTFLTQMSVLLLSGAFDQYTGWGPHNYYLHRDQKSGRWRYLTWDLDVGFADRAFGRVPVLDGWHAAWPVPSTPRPLLERIVGHKELLRRYRARANKVLETYFEPKSIATRLDGLYAQIKHDLKRDPFPSRRVTVPGDRSYDDILRSMKQFMQRRYETAKIQLAQPGERPKPERRGAASGRNRGPDRGPRPGRASSEDPSRLTVVRHDKDGVELAWKDNADGERFFVLQRAGATGAFGNHIGLPGENQQRAKDPHVRVGTTYRYRVYAVKPTARGPFGTGVSNVVTVKVGR